MTGPTSASDVSPARTFAIPASRSVLGDGLLDDRAIAEAKLDDDVAEQAARPNPAGGLKLVGPVCAGIAVVAAAAAAGFDRCGRHNALQPVTRATSASVVSPLRTFARPSSCSVVMPCSIARRAISPAGARATMSARISSLTDITSKSPTRPR